MIYEKRLIFPRRGLKGLFEFIEYSDIGREEMEIVQQNGKKETT